MATQLVDGDVMSIKIACYDTTIHQVSINEVHYYIANSALGGVSDDDVTDVVDQAATIAYKAVLSPQSRYYGCLGQKIYPGTPTVAIAKTARAAFGVFGTVPAPAQLSAVITKQTAGAGRSKRGRLFVPFPPIEAVDTDGTPTVAYNTACAGICNLIRDVQTIIGIPGAANAVPCLYNRVTHGATQVLNFRLNDTFGTQRRRGWYGRQNTIPPF